MGLKGNLNESLNFFQSSWLRCQCHFMEHYN